jgi:hypothetical protein
MLGLSPPRIFQCRNVKALDGADSHGNPVVSVGPIFTRGGSFKPPKPLATARVRAAQHSRVASAPRRISVAARAVSKSWPRRAIRDNVCAATRMAQSERSRPSRTDLTARASPCFQAFRSNRRFMVSTSSPMSCGLRRNAFAPALRATASESVPDIITIGIHRR